MEFKFKSIEWESRKQVLKDRLSGAIPKFFIPFKHAWKIIAILGVVIFFVYRTIKNTLLKTIIPVAKFTLSGAKKIYRRQKDFWQS